MALITKQGFFFSLAHGDLQIVSSKIKALFLDVEIFNGIENVIQARSISIAFLAQMACPMQTQKGG